jgi:hypothetical protein
VVNQISERFLLGRSNLQRRYLDGQQGCRLKRAQRCSGMLCNSQLWNAGTALRSFQPTKYPYVWAIVRAE